MILNTPNGVLGVAARPRDPYAAYGSLPTSTYAGVGVTPEGALALTAVYGAVALVSEANGTMPLEIIDTRASSGAPKRVEGGRMAPMLRYAPNAEMTGPDLWMMVNAHLMLRGNAYLAKLKNTAGEIVELFPLMPWDVNPWRGPQGQKLFRVRVNQGSTFIEVDCDESQILHIKGKSIMDPLVGESTIAHVRNTIGTQLAQSEYQARNYQDGMLIKGVLSTPERNLNPEAVQRVKAQFKSTYQGVANAHDIAVLHSGLTFQPVSLSPEDAQFIQTMKWSHTQVATAFKIPVSRLNGDSGNSLRYANQSQDDLYLDKQALKPLRVMIEAALNRDTDLFGAMSAWVPKFNPNEYLLADVKTRYEVYEIARRIGTASANDVRRAEDQDEIGPQGDDYTPMGGGGAAPAPQGGGEAAVRSAVSSAAAQPQTIIVNTPDVRNTFELPATEPQVVTIQMPEQREQPVPVVNVTTPDVHVHVPEQPAPVVNVEAPSVQVDVAAPEVRVDAPVTVEMPAEQPDGPEPNKVVTFNRDRNGNITGATVKED